uniref:Uncharacterized protein n=1 Tax=Oryza rufipogon TaxID=4529 RepID=A0A0E0Q725_ORYRU
MAAAPVRRWPGAALPSSSLHWLMKKLGEEGPGQDLHASCLSMNQVEIKFLFYLYDAIPFLEDCFHEPPSTTQLKSYGKIGAMFQEVIPKLQCLTEPIQLGSISSHHRHHLKDILLTAKLGSHFSLSSWHAFLFLS